MINPILLASAVIPAIVLLVKIDRADRLEKEPAGLLLSLVALGIVSTFLALMAEQLGDLVVSFLFPEYSLCYTIVFYFGVVAVAEEGAKYLLLKNRTWRHRAFNCQFDGVVYAVFVSLGFALWENISYVAMYGFSTALLRAVTAIPGHACFGVFMGVWYGAAKKYDNRSNNRASAVCRRRALVVPILIHGAYDFIATLGNGFGWLFLLFIGILFLWASRTMKTAAARDTYIDGSDGMLN